VAGIGIMPNTEWLAGSGVTVDDGVRTDEFCRAVGGRDVYALGDAARWHDVSTGAPRRVGHWTNAVDQAELVAHNILRPDAPRAYRAAPYFWSDQYGRKIQMIGHVSPADRQEPVRAGPGREAVLFDRAGLLAAAVTIGWPRAMGTLRRLWARQAPVHEARAELEALPTRTAGTSAGSPV
jgi:NADPH-dependent 2,4-dienoyl-CoA reductase/sulfur reductase-like enzyme